MMTETDTILALGLRGVALSEAPDLASRAAYHGVGPLLLARTGAEVFRDDARVLAMWELRHRHVVVGLLQALASAKVRCVVMKGTALAYGLYPEPALRPRGDSDLLIAPEDLDPARAILRERAFVPLFDQDTAPDAGRSQEPWRLVSPDGSAHDIDLHWQPLNGPSLAVILPTAEALRDAIPLPRLRPGALALSHPHSFLHACVHRAMHILSPYFMGGEAHYGGDRLIWLCDIDLLVKAMTPEDWAIVLDRAETTGIAGVCRQALLDAARLLGTAAPEAALDRLAATPPGALSDYLLRSGRIGRALSDLKALGHREALRHAAYWVFPPASFIRMKYPRSRLPLGLLYLRRIGGLLTRGRP